MSLKQGIAFEETAHKLVLLRAVAPLASTNQSKFCALQLDVWVQVDFTVIA